MPDPDLRATLSALRPPAPSETARARALHRATLALAAPAAVAERRSRFVPSSALPIFATLASCLLLALGIWSTPPSVAPSAIASADSSRQLLAELHALFPGQLNAVIDRDGTLKLDLAASSSLPPAAEDQAVVVELNRAGFRLRILAYSGRPVHLELDGVPFRLDPLLTSDGDVLLAGDTFVWSSAEPAADALDGWHIAARPLGLPL